MARSKYIYLVRTVKNDDLVGTFTVKHEAHSAVVDAVKNRQFDLDMLKLSRRHGYGPLTCSEEQIKWDKTLLCDATGASIAR